MKGCFFVELKYRTSDIEEVLNALNRLHVIGIANAEIVTFIVQKLSKSSLSENNEVGVADGN